MDERVLVQIVAPLFDAQHAVPDGHVIAICRDVLRLHRHRFSCLYGEVGILQRHLNGGEIFRRCVRLVGEVQLLPIALLVQCAGTDRRRTTEHAGANQADTRDNPRFYHCDSLLSEVTCSSCFRRSNCALGRVSTMPAA